MKMMKYSVCLLGVAAVSVCSAAMPSPTSAEETLVDHTDQAEATSYEPDVTVGYGMAYSSMTNGLTPTIDYYNGDDWEMRLGFSYNHDRDDDGSSVNTYWVNAQVERLREINPHIYFTYGVDGYYGFTDGDDADKEPYLVGPAIGVEYRTANDQLICYVHTMPYSHERETDGDQENAVFANGMFGISYRFL